MGDSKSTAETIGNSSGRLGAAIDEWRIVEVDIEPPAEPHRPLAGALTGVRAALGMPMRHEVTAADTATALGSGDVPVLATPRLIEWMEAATVRATPAFLGTGQTTVGTAVHIEHHRATTVGKSVAIAVTPPRHATSRRLSFDVQAIDTSGQVIAAGEIDRMIVDRDRFLASTSDAHAGH